jgi:hypothetical protein
VYQPRACFCRMYFRIASFVLPGGFGVVSEPNNA